MIVSHVSSNSSSSSSSSSSPPPSSSPAAVVRNIAAVAAVVVQTPPPRLLASHVSYSASSKEVLHLPVLPCLLSAVSSCISEILSTGKTRETARPFFDDFNLSRRGRECRGDRRRRRRRRPFIAAFEERIHLLSDVDDDFQESYQLQKRPQRYPLVVLVDKGLLYILCFGGGVVLERKRFDLSAVRRRRQSRFRTSQGGTRSGSVMTTNAKSKPISLLMFSGGGLKKTVSGGGRWCR